MYLQGRTVVWLGMYNKNNIDDRKTINKYKNKFPKVK